MWKHARSARNVSALRPSSPPQEHAFAYCSQLACVQNGGLDKQRWSQSSAFEQLALDTIAKPGDCQSSVAGHDDVRGSAAACDRTASDDHESRKDIACASPKAARPENAKLAQPASRDVTMRPRAMGYTIPFASRRISRVAKNWPIISFTSSSAMPSPFKRFSCLSAASPFSVKCNGELNASAAPRRTEDVHIAMRRLLGKHHAMPRPAWPRPKSNMDNTAQGRLPK
eukprot:TRINITY_DN80384_c0_g1_i1.p2 TRINITY_DN80384_c0_g1~~TRINITY_DN80384_c0_g1_i1.p2  ORF type:complete len:227 (-),score=10.63 TRINITY_DN80384_c0_g1_i1:957-1637(-)